MERSKDQSIAELNIFGMLPSCTNCAAIGTTKALIRNDEGDVCGVIYSCAALGCLNKIRDQFTQGDQPITYRPYHGERISGDGPIPAPAQLHIDPDQSGTGRTTRGVRHD